MATMDRKQREVLVIALHEKGKTYREITKELRLSPNTIKAILNRVGLDQTNLAMILFTSLRAASTNILPKPPTFCSRKNTVEAFSKMLCTLF